MGFGLALLVDGVGVGCAVGRLADLLCLDAGLECGCWLGEGVAPAWPGLPLDRAGLADGLAVDAVVAAGASWLNRFMNPATAMALSAAARQVNLDSLRNPASRAAPSRCWCRIGGYEIEDRVKRAPRVIQGGAPTRCWRNRAVRVMQLACDDESIERFC